VILPIAGLGEAYQDAFVETGKQAELFFLVAFLLTFGFVRLSTHMIRAQVSWWPGNVEVGGTHVHHLVFGIIMILVVGYVGIAIQPPDPGREILAVLFGVGAALTLDEFALWLNLKDVYWEKEGRRSIDAVIAASVLAAMVILGFRIWIDLAHGVEAGIFALVGAFGGVKVIFVLINFAKGKVANGLIGLVVSPVSLVGAIRLAKPHSPWAKTFYRDHKMRRAIERHERHRRRMARLLRRAEPQAESAAGSG
jgi:hypothetical protein